MSFGPDPAVRICLWRNPKVKRAKAWLLRTANHVFFNLEKESRLLLLMGTQMGTCFFLGFIHNGVNNLY